MAFTTATITHTFTDDNGNPSLGVVTFTLTEAMTNGAHTVSKGSAFDSVLVAGVLSQVGITSNVDVGTTPLIPQAEWRVDIRIDNALVETYFITVPSGGGSFDLFSLIPDTEQVN